MRPKSLSAPLLITFLSSFLFSQTYKDDSLAVRAILDANSLDSVLVTEVTIIGGERIQELDLFELGLTVLPGEIGKLTALKYLVLSQNNLTIIPKEIQYCENLQFLYLVINKLSTIPEEIGLLSNLEEIALSSNDLDRIPPEIGNLTKLKKLKLMYNNLTTLPAEIGNLYLDILSVGHNKLNSLPDSIIELKTFIESTYWGLDLSNNNLDTNNLSEEIIAWADMYDKDWRETQNTHIIYNKNFSINQKILSMNIQNSSILFNLQTSSTIKLQMCNMKGRLLSTLVDSYKQAGSYSVNWDSRKYGSGVYFLKLYTGDSSIIQKAFLVK